MNAISGLFGCMGFVIFLSLRLFCLKEMIAMALLRECHLVDESAVESEATDGARCMNTSLNGTFNACKIFSSVTSVWFFSPRSTYPI